jgi:hypothetical protein
MYLVSSSGNYVPSFKLWQLCTYFQTLVSVVSYSANYVVSYPGYYICSFTPWNGNTLFTFKYVDGYDILCPGIQQRV